MEFNPLILVCRYCIIIIYAIICFISIIFTFFIERYEYLNELLELEIINSLRLTILESSKVSIDDWLFIHHRVVGPILFLLSLFDAHMLNNLIMRL
jgi:hypothetical protein